MWLQRVGVVRERGRYVSVEAQDTIRRLRVCSLSQWLWEQFGVGTVEQKGRLSKLNLITSIFSPASPLFLDASICPPPHHHPCGVSFSGTMDEGMGQQTPGGGGGGSEESISSLCPCSWQGALCWPKKPAAGLRAMGGSLREWLQVLGSFGIQKQPHFPEQLRQHHLYFMDLLQSSVLTAFLSLRSICQHLETFWVVTTGK